MNFRWALVLDCLSDFNVQLPEGKESDLYRHAKLHYDIAGLIHRGSPEWETWCWIRHRCTNYDQVLKDLSRRGLWKYGIRASEVLKARLLKSIGSLYPNLHGRIMMEMEYRQRWKQMFYDEEMRDLIGSH